MSQTDQSNKGQTKAVWNARCKSGYTFPHMTRVVSVRMFGRTVSVDRQTDKACNQVCARGQIVCSACASATVVLTERSAELSTWALSEVRA